jgi:hypothetical protein
VNLERLVLESEEAMKMSNVMLKGPGVNVKGFSISSKQTRLREM